VLDEPTNHLDIDSIEALEAALERYDGTVVAVSHDRYFLDRIADRIMIVADGAATAHDGGWSVNEDLALAACAESGSAASARR
jgi:ATP-binding cassette subfamily F protein 3